MNLNYTKGSIAVYVVYNEQHLINTLKHVWLQRFFLRPIAVDNILANFMGSTIMTISCLFSTIEGMSGQPQVKDIIDFMPPWEAFCTKRCGLYQDFYLVLWDDPKEMLTWEVGRWAIDGHVLFWGEDDLNGLVAPVIHRLMLTDTSHSVCISYLYLFVLATSALHNLT